MKGTVNNPFLSRKYNPNADDIAYFEDIAYSWNRLQNVLSMLDEVTLIKMYQWEMDNARRIHFLNRIKSRHTRLRDQRERAEIFDEFGITY
jgi:hypothetical protein